MNIPFLDLKAQYKNIQKEIDKKILDVVKTQRFIMGPEVEALEKEMASYCGSGSAVGVSSGSDALLVSLMALGVGRDDEVITTPFTFFATAGTVARLGAKPVFCDIQRNTFNLDPKKLESLLESQRSKNSQSRIRAIIPVHLYGQCAEMDTLSSLAKDFQLKIIEDAAQAVGAEYSMRGEIKKAGSLGDLGILSFFPSKNLGGYGDGGMVLTDDKELASQIRLLRVHGSENKYHYKFVGGNFRLDSLQAAVLRVKLKYLDGWLEMKKEKASHYKKLFWESGLPQKGLIQCPSAVYRNGKVNHYHTYHQYVIRAQRRDELKKYLKEKGISTAVYYPRPLHLQECFAYLGYREGDFPESEKASSEVLALPVYPELSSKQQEYIVSRVKEFYR
ncbi:DegT/DnrJ/EryC1/StrS family aminotransferase [bacterium]|nr:DegT/DnrJ/EryC1/StrS family aminotransferase [bacterium]